MVEKLTYLVAMVTKNQLCDLVFYKYHNMFYMYNNDLMSKKCIIFFVVVLVVVDPFKVIPPFCNAQLFCA